MTYKDKDKQREANRQASKKYRDSMTGKGMTEIIPKSDIRVIPSESHIDASDVGAVKTLHRLIKALPVKPKILKRKTLAEITNKPKPQSHSPMMVGYVPPER